jgi:hypothetical protein
VSLPLALAVGTLALALAAATLWLVLHAFDRIERELQSDEEIAEANARPRGNVATLERKR